MSQPRINIFNGTCTLAADSGSITCLVCGASSSHPQDISERYCPRCHQFHEILSLQREYEQQLAGNDAQTT